MMHATALKTEQRSRLQIDATALKLFACILMVLDHIHQMFVYQGAPAWLAMAGRPVFPIFLFTAAESFHYTHSKKHYLGRLLLASIGMSVFTLVLQRIVPNSNVVLMNNAFSTFFVAGLYMQSWDWLTNSIRMKSWKSFLKATLCAFIPILFALPAYLVALLSFNDNIKASTLQLLANISLLLPSILTAEGGLAMVALGTAFYIFRKHRWAQAAVLLALSAATYMVDGGIQWLMCLAVIPICLYNGKCGKGMKRFFYIFYPAHIGVLYILSSVF